VTWIIHQGDCIEQMAKLDSVSVDAVVCDPPYGLEFMGKKWDRLGAARPAQPGAASGRAQQDWHLVWATEVLRVLKPGGYLLAFGGTRTFHRLACAVEDAGFEIRDSIMWLYGSGFPKSLDVSKAIDKAAGAEREEMPDPQAGRRNSAPRAMAPGGGKREAVAAVTAPATPEAAQWEGWGTALKPAHEPIVVARKPLIGTVAANVLEHGTGGVNIDACRVGTESTERPNGANALGVMNDDGWEPTEGTGGSIAGRWPANVVLSHTEDCELTGTKVVRPSNGSGKASAKSGGLSGIFGEGSDEDRSGGQGGEEIVEAWNCAPGCPVAELDSQSGGFDQQWHLRWAAIGRERSRGGAMVGSGETTGFGDSGGASRFFYCAKTSRSERNVGLGGFEELPSLKVDPTSAMARDGRRGSGVAANHHPTVKPINLMRWLCRLVTPPGGTVLDPFLGSGTTGCAAVLEDFDFFGIEREPEYIAIAEARIGFWAQHEGREVEDVLGDHSISQRQRRVHEGAGQLGLEVA
jgi:site-specific DNA-methyltransferase (adenine-specific)